MCIRDSFTSSKFVFFHCQERCRYTREQSLFEVWIWRAPKSLSLPRPATLCECFPHNTPERRANVLCTPGIYPAPEYLRYYSSHGTVYSTALRLHRRPLQKPPIDGICIGRGSNWERQKTTNRKKFRKRFQKVFRKFSKKLSTSFRKVLKRFSKS